jgi:cyclopropane fatty-acyl-phospholipid synthase-like methyltransferase
MFTEQDVIDYYDITETHYKSYWHLDKCLAMHYGFHDAENKTFEQALINMNKQLAKRVGINENDHVLDAGCGVGGSSIFLAKNYGCKAHGITLSAKQVKTAQNYAKKRKLDHLVNFSQENYQQTSFNDERFDVIWAIESVCHSFDQAQFYKEVYRLLKPNGRLIIADYSEEMTIPESEKNELRKWLSCWSIKSIPSTDKMKEYLSPFSSHKIENITENILPSAKYMYRMHYLGMIPHRIYDFFFTASKQSENNFQSAKYQYLALKKKAWQYRIITATK